jgi:DNA primase
VRIPEEKIEEIRAATDIVAVVQEYVTLRKKGQNHFGLCPFHQENSPSFSVHPGRGIFRCFGCGKGGNVFGFLMEMERITFYEAIKLLAEKAGIKLPTYRESNEEGPSESELLIRGNGLARDFFYQQLTSAKSTGAQEAKSYLANRCYGDDVIERYTLGYAPDTWESLAEHARSQSFPLNVLVKAGLLKESPQTGRPYDAFRHRVMFPIRNLSGRVIGFGGRRLREEAEGPDSAKYINSPETAVYHKGRELFGLWEARSEIRRQERAILVEGYTDVVSLAIAGVSVAVASLGTSLTEDQARLLKRFTDRVFILYDGDSAGLNAARRAVDILLGVGLVPKVVVLPEGEDPDSYVQKNGGEAVWQLVNEAISSVAFQLLLSKRARVSTSDAVRELLTSASQISSHVEREVFLKEVAEKSGVSFDALLRELPRVATTSPKQHAEQGEQWPPKSPITTLAMILIQRPDLRRVVFAKLNFEDIQDSRLAELLRFLQEDVEHSSFRKPEALLDRFPDPPLRDFISECLFADENNNADLKRAEIEERMVRDCLGAMESAKLKAQIALLKEKLAAAPDSVELFREMQELMKKEKTLR